MDAISTVRKVKRKDSLGLTREHVQGWDAGLADHVQRDPVQRAGDIESAMPGNALSRHAVLSPSGNVPIVGARSARAWLGRPLPRLAVSIGSRPLLHEAVAEESLHHDHLQGTAQTQPGLSRHLGGELRSVQGLAKQSIPLFLLALVVRDCAAKGWRVWRA